jgi:hypothetical protein
VYWAAGGEYGRADAVPSGAVDRPAFVPGKIATLLVAFLLGAAAFALAVRITPSATSSPVFIARAIGDFRYIGFFKRVRNARFGRRDTVLYSPLCAVLATTSALAASTF